MFTICSRHRPSRRSPGRRSDGPGQGPVKPDSAGFGPIPGKTRGFLADTNYALHYTGPSYARKLVTGRSDQAAALSCIILSLNTTPL